MKTGALFLLTLSALAGHAIAQTYDDQGRLIVADTINDGSTAGAADVINSTPGGSEYGLVCRSIPSGTQAVSGTVAATQSGTWTVQPGNTANTTPWLTKISDGTDSLDITASGEAKALCTAQPGVDIGDVTVNNASIAVTGPLTDAQLRATPVPVSGSVTASGTVTSNQGTPASTANRWPVQVTDGTDLALVSGGGSLQVTCDNCGGASPFEDEDAFTVGTSSVAAIGYLVDETTPDSAPEDSAAAPRMAPNRIPYAILRDAAGNERGANVSASNALKVDGSAVTQPISGTVSQGTPAAGANAWPFYITDTTDIALVTAGGRLTVDGSGVTQPVSGSVTVSGTVTANQGTAAATAAAWPTYITDGTDIALVSAGGSLVVTGAGGTFPATQSGTWVLGANSGVDIGDVTINNAAGASAVNIQDGGNTITVDGTVTTSPPSNASTNVAQFGGTNVSTGTGAGGAGIPRVTVSNDSNVLATQSGTWTVQPGNTQNTTAWLTQDLASKVDDAAYTPATDRVMVVGGEMDDALANDVEEGDAGAVRISAQRAMHVQLRSGSAEIGSTGSPLNIQGPAAVDAAASGNPVRQGAYAEADAAALVSVSAEGDMQDLKTNLEGRLLVETDHPRRFYANTISTATTLTELQAAPGAGLSLYITDILYSSSIISTATADAHPTLAYGTGTNCGTGTTRFWRCMIPTTFNSCPAFNGTTPIKLPANNALCFIHTGAGTRLINISGYTAP